MAANELPEFLCQRYIGNRLNCMGPAAPADKVRAAVEMLLDIIGDLRHQVMSLEHALDEERRAAREIEQLRLDLAQHKGNASEVIRLKDRENAVAKIIARALACDDYRAQHAEWMADAAKWLNDEPLEASQL